MVFMETTRECTNIFVVSIQNESETKGNKRIRNDFKKSFCLSSSLKMMT